MLERRAGEDVFRKHVEGAVAAVLAPPGEPVAGGQPDAAPVKDGKLEAWGFIRLNVGDEVGAFMARWVYGRGVPHITAAFEYHRRGSVLEVGMLQSGSKAARRAAEEAEGKAALGGIGTGVIKLVVREGSGATVDHPVHVGDLPVVVKELKVNPEVKKIAQK